MEGGCCCDVVGGILLPNSDTWWQNEGVCNHLTSIQPEKHLIEEKVLILDGILSLTISKEYTGWGITLTTCQLLRLTRDIIFNTCIWCWRP